MRYYVNSSGEFPMQSGNPVLISKFAFKECCCGTPCFCATVYEWDCDANDWVLTFQGKTCQEDGVFFLTPPPDDQWNIVYGRRRFPRSATGIVASYGTWVGAEEDCPSPGSPPAPAEIWRAWKCDGSEPPDEPNSDADCQKMAFYEYDCAEEEWLLVRVDVIKARVPKNTEVVDPDNALFVIVFGEIFSCDEDDLPADPRPPKTVKQAEIDEFCLCSQALDSYTMSLWSQVLTFYSAGDTTCTGTPGVTSYKRIKNEGSVTLNRTTGCEWTGSFVIENSNDGINWSDYQGGSLFTATMSHDGETGKWTLDVNTDTVTRPSVIEWFGPPDDPTGAHSDDVECDFLGSNYSSGTTGATIS